MFGEADLERLVEVSWRMATGRRPTAAQTAMVLERWRGGVGQLELGADPPATVPAVKARTTDPATSHAAARGDVSIRRGQRRRLVEALRYTEVGLTAEELAVRTLMPLNSVSTRMSELVRGGYVAERGTRLTSAGAKATVYVLSNRGHEALESEVASA